MLTKFEEITSEFNEVIYFMKTSLHVRFLFPTWRETSFFFLQIDLTFLGREFASKIFLNMSFNPPRYLAIKNDSGESDSML
jgi:hypothetical protein